MKALNISENTSTFLRRILFPLLSNPLLNLTDNVREEKEMVVVIAEEIVLVEAVVGADLMRRSPLEPPRILLPLLEEEKTEVSAALEDNQPIDKKEEVLEAVVVEAVVLPGPKRCAWFQV